MGRIRQKEKKAETRKEEMMGQIMFQKEKRKG